MNSLVEITEDLLKINFKNTFLELVAFEVRFPTDLTIYEKIPKFQGKIKDNYSVYSERFSIPTPFKANIEKSNLLDFSFKNRTEETEIYLNSYSIFGLRTKSYSGFNTFSDNFLKCFKIFKELCQIKIITRLGLRYINIIPHNTDLFESIQLKNNYFYSLLDSNINENKFENQNIDLRYKKGDYEIHQQYIFRKNQNNQYETIIDIDNSFKDKIEIEENLTELKDKINNLHNLIKVIFFETIKEEFLNKLKGLGEN